MSMKRNLFALLAAGMMLLAVGGVASAAPNQNANCVAHAAQGGGQGISSYTPRVIYTNHVDLVALQCTSES